MTVVQSREFYEFMISNEEEIVECEGCGKEMEMPDTDDLNADMKEPFWVEEDVHTYIGGNYNKMYSVCESCLGKKPSEIIEEEVEQP